MPILRFVSHATARFSQSSSDPDPLLFARYDLHGTLTAQAKLIDEEVVQVPPDELARVDPGEFLAYLEAKYLVDPVSLDTTPGHIVMTDEPFFVDVPSEGWESARGRVVQRLEGIAISFRIPIVGQPELLDCTPNVRYMYPGHPHGVVQGQDLVVTRRGAPGVTAAQMRPGFEEELQEIQKRLGDVNKQLAAWNQRMHDKIRTRLSKRRARLADIAKAFPYRLRPRTTDPAPYAALGLRRQIVQAGHDGAYLSMEQYDEILVALERMSLVFERAPSAFERMSEEHLRHHFLVPLNVLFAGEASAETFNFSGKTDILLRFAGRTLFVAECKFWTGKRSLSRAVDQLLGYATWRDTKLALVVFNRGRKLSSVLAQVMPVLQAHSQFLREEPGTSDTRFRVVLSHPDDPARELLLTVLVFELPQGQLPAELD